ncbi:hypothetical protein ASPFODRAFT_54375 [Aspergillus luchuensis CBS 106.47]|uniref:Uncharacterized protein n=1 Tax=Aspergillus luchuensis (strain CBS 106.47) TaxID=1137211 RepID=A0A1M3SZF0_ASPLC|nr:hypothetical protein ASPFODRAFT_54375 [Aspergillus luchuensis CBS 106.47]
MHLLRSLLTLTGVYYSANAETMQVYSETGYGGSSQAVFFTPGTPGIPENCSDFAVEWPIRSIQLPEKVICVVLSDVGCFGDEEDLLESAPDLSIVPKSFLCIKQ